MNLNFCTLKPADSNVLKILTTKTFKISFFLPFKMARFFTVKIIKKMNPRMSGDGIVTAEEFVTHFEKCCKVSFICKVQACKT